MIRMKPGDMVRLYGYPGLFCVWPAYMGRGDFWAVPAGTHHACGFPASERSVVEVNGRPLPLLSCPLVPPASDYPHEPQFLYTDGPQANGRDALAKWRALQTV